MTKLFGRLGTRRDIDTQIVNAKKTLGKDRIIVKDDKEAGTVDVRVSDSDVTVFKAIQKDPRVWIVMYNSAFYPR